MLVVSKAPCFVLEAHEREAWDTAGDQITEFDATVEYSSGQQ